MPIAVACSSCRRRFSAPDRAAGRNVPCPNCGTPIAIPWLADDGEELRLADEPAPPVQVAPPPAPPPAKWSKPKLPLQPPQPRAAAPVTPPAKTASAPPPAVLAPPPAPALAAPAGWVPATKSSTPAWLRHLHWALALAMIPLAVSVFGPDESPEELMRRLLRALKGEDATAQVENSSAEELEAELERLLGDASLDDVLGRLPDRKLQGAFLPRNSGLHWLFALVSVAAYMTFFLLLASDRSARSWHLLGVGAFVGTFGIVLLVIVQVLAMIGPVGGDGIVAIVITFLSLIGLSYRAALDPDIGFVGSFLGFTFGVGLCEEMVKALPLFILYRLGTQQNWRGAFLWGLAAGAGFGVSEGIMYSADYYNGITGPGIYLVRFVSCVALHAVWSGSVGIAINQWQHLLRPAHEDWWVNWLLYWLGVLRMIAVPMVLHGLYDTLLKKELELLALVVAAASFGYLAWMISRLRTSDDEDERAAYVAKYIRSQTAG